MTLKIIFAGTPDFALPTLQNLFSQHEVIAVYTQPDRPAGRGRHLTASPIKQWATTKAIPIYQPQTLRNIDEQKQLKNLNADLMVVVAYGLILPKEVLNIPRLGCINVHASLLPRWRGAAPIQRAILAGDLETGITIMQMDEGLDTGAIFKQCSYILKNTDTSFAVHQHLAHAGAKLLAEVLTDLESENIKSHPQENATATYAAKINKSEAEIDWSRSAIDIDRQIRAFNPAPGAFTFFKNQILKIWEAQPLLENKLQPPGHITAIDPHHLEIACGKGSLLLLKVQPAGSKIISITDFINAHKSHLFAGQKL